MQEPVRLGGKGNPLWIMQETEISTYQQIVFVQNLKMDRMKFSRAMRYKRITRFWLEEQT